QIGVHQLLGDFDADHAGSQHQDVHVVVLDPLVGRVVVVGEAGADAAELVGRDRRTDARAANENATPASAEHAQRDLGGEVRVINGTCAIGAHVLDGDAALPEVGHEHGL